MNILLDSDFDWEKKKKIPFSGFPGNVFAWRRKLCKQVRKKKKMTVVLNIQSH